MPFDIRHLLVYLCAALLAVAPGLAWGAVTDGSSVAAGAASTLISGNGQGDADTIDLGTFLFSFILGAISALVVGVALHTKRRQGTAKMGAAEKCNLHIEKNHESKDKPRSDKDDGSKSIKFTLIISLFGPILWFFVYDVDGRSIIAFIIGLILTATEGRKLHHQWAHYLFVTMRRNLKRNQSFKNIYNKNPTTKQIIDSVSRFIPATLLVGLVFSLFVEIEILALIGSIIGPFLAVFASTWLHDRWAKKERRNKIFNTLVALKKYVFSHERVQALNAVKLEFNESYVLAAWKKYADYMEQSEGMRNQDQEEILYDALLESMAAALGDRSKDIEHSYAPEAHLNLLKLDANLKTSLLKVLVGEEPIAIRDSKRKVAEALYIQGVRFRDGDGVSPNPKKAIRLIRESDSMDDAKAKNAMGEMHLYGKGVKKDDDEARNLFKNATDEGVPEAQNHLGVMYAEKDENFKDAEKLFLLAAKNGLSIAQYNLMLMYAKGDAAGENDLQAKKMLESVAYEGFADAQYLSGLLGEEVIYRQYLSADLKDEKYLHHTAVEENSEIVLAQGGGIANSPVHNAVTITNSLDWYKYAAEQGHEKARGKLKERIYESDPRVENDPMMSNAPYYLGEIYRDGKGVAKDLQEAYIWFSMAADSGHREALKHKKKIAKRIDSVQIEGDIDIRKHCENGAWSGHANDQHMLGRMYRDGTGSAKDLKEAYIWFSISVGGGHGEALQDKNLVTDQLRNEGFTPDQFGAIEDKAVRRKNKIDNP